MRLDPIARFPGAQMRDGVAHVLVDEVPPRVPLRGVGDQHGVETREGDGEIGGGGHAPAFGLARVQTCPMRPSKAVTKAATFGPT